MDFAFHGSARDLAMVRFDDRLAEALEAAGHTRVRLTPRGGGADVVFAHIGPECGPPYQRPDPTVLVVGLLRVPRPVEDLGEFAYGCLVRSVSDLLITVTGPEDTPETWVAGLDRPLERIAAQAWSRRHFALLLERLQPLLGAHLAMDNIFDRDLDEGLLDGGSAVEELRRAAAALADQGALPEGYPVRDVVGSKDASQLERLARARSISYGDLSAREDELRFWMTTSGVDWRRIEVVGRDVELVKGYDPQSRALLISVPPGVRPRRTSPDALGHLLIYRQEPRVGAIMHLHAWLSTVERVVPDYPRGSVERARSLADTVRTAADPVHAVVGIERHGILVTGEGPDEIVQRLRGAEITPVPPPAGGAPVTGRR